MSLSACAIAGAPSKPNAAASVYLTEALSFRYILLKYMLSIDHARKNGSAELLVLAQLETRPRHGYEIASEIERRSGGSVSFLPASLYPVLYRMEREGWIAGRWIEKPGQHRRRYYRLTPSGRKQLAAQRSSWSQFLAGLRQTAGLQDA
jgi:PadR family transcriptional regulator, regulatory protein PadR